MLEMPWALNSTDALRAAIRRNYGFSKGSSPFTVLMVCAFAVCRFCSDVAALFRGLRWFPFFFVGYVSGCWK